MVYLIKKYSKINKYGNFLTLLNFLKLAEEILTLFNLTHLCTNFVLVQLGLGLGSTLEQIKVEVSSQPGNKKATSKQLGLDLIVIILVCSYSYHTNLSYQLIWYEFSSQFEQQPP